MDITLFINDIEKAARLRKNTTAVFQGTFSTGYNGKYNQKNDGYRL